MTAPFAIPNRPGNHRIPCPQCGRGPRDTALSVTVEPDGRAVFLCFRCGFKGADGEFQRGEIQPRRKPKPDTTDKTAKARRLIERARPIRGTLAERYLQSRGLTLPADTPLLYMPDAFHWPTGLNLPCMVAPMVDIKTNQIQAVYQTFLRPDGSGKADVDRPRLYMGPKSGGCVKLTPDDEAVYSVAIAEGIETALSIRNLPDMESQPVWATLDAGNLAKFPVLNGLETLWIAADHDRAGILAARKCAERWADAGREVIVISPTEAAHDLNDIMGGADAG